MKIPTERPMRHFFQCNLRLVTTRRVASIFRQLAFASLLATGAAGLIASGAQPARLSGALRESSPGSEGKESITEKSNEVEQNPSGFHAGDFEIIRGTEILHSLAPIEFLPEHSSGSKRSIDLDVRFELNSTTLTPFSLHQLDELGAALTSKELAYARFEIAGHTDAIGSDIYNHKLSERRAAAVQKYLVEVHGVDAARVNTLGYGESRLKDSRNPNSGINRRVEIVALYPPALERLQAPTKTPWIE